MKKFKLTSLIIFCISLFSAANLAAASSDDYPWKTQPPFEITSIDGLMSGYQAGSPISFYVIGKSYVDIEAEPKNGFSVSASVYDVPRTKTFQSVTGKYDEEKHGWQVDFTAPQNSSLSYEIELQLYCGKDESQCAQIYGISAQTTKQMPLYIQ